MRLFVALTPVVFGRALGEGGLPTEAKLELKRGDRGFSDAFAGLRQGVNDLIEMLTEATPAQQHMADEALEAAGLGRLGALLAEQTRFIKGLLRRGSVVSKTEYYALREVVLGSGAGLEAAEVERAEAMLAAFERRISIDQTNR